MVFSFLKSDSELVVFVDLFDHLLDALRTYPGRLKIPIGVIALVVHFHPAAGLGFVF
jgi:hypothetical protein